MQAFYDLAPLELIRRKRVQWIFDGNRTDIISSLRSKSLRKFLTKAENLLAEQGITWDIKPISVQEYAEWLPFYEQHMKLLNHDLLAKPDWYEKKIAEGKEVVGIFFRKDTKLVGSGIAVQTAKKFISFAYKASDFISLSSQSNSSLGSVIDYMYLKYACTNGFETISGGRSYNAFGVETTLGYLEFKTNFYVPVLSETEEVTHSVPLPENPEKPVLFYGEKLDQPLIPALCILTKTPLTEEQLKQYLVPTISYKVIQI
mgnify:CR=1 FL=1